MVGRLVNALVTGEPDAREHPYRRVIVATMVGTAIGVLLIGGFAVFGLLVPGGAQRWREPGSIVVEKETGTRYVYDGARLRPVLNLASARLLFDQPPKMVEVSGLSLTQVPRGQAVGIAGAPDTLPRNAEVARQVWTACTVTGHDAAGAPVIATTLSIGDLRAVGGPADPGAPLAPDEATVVGAGTNSYLIWRGHRLRLTQSWQARVFGYDAAPYSVEPDWLETVPVGPDLTAIPVPGRGEEGPIVDGERARIGELFLARSDGLPDRYYQLRADGLSQLSEVAYIMLAADPATGKAYPGRAVAAANLSRVALASLPSVRLPLLPDGAPENVPRMRQRPTGGWCLRQSMADGAVSLTDSPPRTDPVDDGLALTRTAHTADGIAVSPGTGGLVYPGRVGQPPGATIYLVVDSGAKFPLAGAEAAKRLGYSIAGARPVPRQLLDLLPTGPLLDIAPGGG